MTAARRDALLARVAEAAAALDLRGRRVLVAVSGGVDSCVLLAALGELAGDLELALAVGHVNHGLRGAASDADEAFVRALAAERALPAHVRRVTPAALREGRPSRARPTLQEAARRVRYDALAQMAEAAGADRIATAHTLDDQAETVMLRLLRGAGPAALGGIPERSPDGRIVRPLLGVSRAEVERWAKERRLSWREDASNRDPAFARARMRGQLSALGAGFNPRWLRAIGDLAEAQRREAEWTEAIVREEASRRMTPRADALAIDVAGWTALPVALRRRLARHALREMGASRDVSRRHLERIDRFLASARGGSRLELPGGLSLVRARGAALLQRGGSEPGC
jgi:tRNA(Ile)-lysidine synthase